MGLASCHFSELSIGLSELLLGLRITTLVPPWACLRLSPASCRLLDVSPACLPEALVFSLELPSPLVRYHEAPTATAARMWMHITCVYWTSNKLVESQMRSAVVKYMALIVQSHTPRCRR